MKVSDIKKGDWFHADYQGDICVRIITDTGEPIAWSPGEDSMNHPQYMCSLCTIRQCTLDSGYVKPIPCPEEYVNFKWRDEYVND